MIKKCGCGIVWNTLPKNARYHSNGDMDLFAGTYFECTCLSTLFIPEKTIEERAIILAFLKDQHDKTLSFHRA